MFVKGGNILFLFLELLIIIPFIAYMFYSISANDGLLLLSSWSLYYLSLIFLVFAYKAHKENKKKWAIIGIGTFIVFNIFATIITLS